MRQFDALPDGGEMDRVIANDIAAAQGVHADDLFGACADVAMPAVDGQVLVGSACGLGENFPETPRGSAGRVEFVPVVHLDDFLVVVFAQHFRRDLRQVEKKVHADGEIRREDDGYAMRGRLDRLALLSGVAGRSDHHGLAVVRHDFHQIGGEGMMRELDHRIATVDGVEHVVALVDARGEFQPGILPREPNQRFTHPAFRADNHDPGLGAHDLKSKFFQDDFQPPAILWLQRHERKAHVLAHPALAGEGRLDRHRVGFDEQVAEKRVVLVMKLRRFGITAATEGAHHVADLLRNQV